ncbi:hypothetical protein RJ639_030650 [Escallonia herrerae]|uniref:Transposase (putative) gypsy type domain-containing protein n=1 Tax=Escallonia herrerae TaxID=1293975 RepID=A0AA88WY58_9ASTE|nr:hypothetical protein RJ639_030650 [Escallonia herrerae]
MQLKSSGQKGPKKKKKCIALKASSMMDQSLSEEEEDLNNKEMDILAKEFNEFLKLKKVGNSHMSKNDSSVEITSWENKKKKGSRKKHSIKTSIEAITCSDNNSSGDEGEFCSDGILLGQSFVRHLSLCSGRVFGLDSVRTEFCSAIVTLLGHNVRTGFCSDRILLDRCHSARAECSDRILFGRCHSAPAECSDRILFGQNYARPLSLCSGRVFGHDSVKTKFCLATVTLLGQSVQKGFCSNRILLGHDHSVRAECSDTILLGQDSVRTRSLYTRRVFGHDPARTGFYSAITLDQADDKANPKPWYTADEKSGKMSTEDLQDLIQEYPLPEGWYARLPGLQEPANYGTKFETGIYEEQVKSGYRLPLHPFALRFFEHYRVAPGQLVPNGWRKLASLIYLVQTSGYKPDATDFMRVFFKICFVKGVANCPGWYYIHNKGELPFDRDWNPFCKDFENPGKPTPNNLTKHILSHIKLRGGLCIDEPLSEEQLEWAKIIPPKPIPVGLLIPSPLPAIPSMSSAETVPLEMASGSGKSPQGGFLGVVQKAKGKQKEKQPSAELPLFLRGVELFLQNVLHMYASGSEMLSRFEMARQVAADEAQQKREAVKEAQEASHRAEELSKQEADHLAQIGLWRRGWSESRGRQQKR